MNANTPNVRNILRYNRQGRVWFCQREYREHGETEWTLIIGRARIGIVPSNEHAYDTIESAIYMSGWNVTKGLYNA